MEPDSVVPRKRERSMADDVDDYLWEVYQRPPIKRDSTGDFSWKDPAAAKRMGLSVEDYVIGGMDPEFREQLYHAGKAMDAAGMQWSMLSAFRDDYRQQPRLRLQGARRQFAARRQPPHRRLRPWPRHRHHAAPTATRATVWKWLDAHGAKYGLYRPMPGADPAHVQPVGEWHKSSVATREARSRTAAATHGRHKRNKLKFARAGR